MLHGKQENGHRRRAGYITSAVAPGWNGGDMSVRCAYGRWRQLGSTPKSRVRRKKVFGLERQAFHAGLPLSGEASHTLPTLLQWPSLLPTTTQTPENGLVYGMYEKRNEDVGSTVGQRQGQGWRGHHSTQRTHDHAVAWQHVAAIRMTGPRTKEVLPHKHGQLDDGRALAR